MSLFPENPDELSDKELAHIREILTDATESNNLTQWEDDFCADMLDRVQTYGKRTRISDRQMEVIDRIENKLYG